jgi:hypothetical protein
VIDQANPLWLLQKETALYWCQVIDLEQKKCSAFVSVMLVGQALSY